MLTSSEALGGHREAEAASGQVAAARQACRVRETHSAVAERAQAQADSCPSVLARPLRCQALWVTVPRTEFPLLEVTCFASPSRVPDFPAPPKRGPLSPHTHRHQCRLLFFLVHITQVARQVLGPRLDELGGALPAFGGQSGFLFLVTLLQKAED